ncbi:hypothetical protein [Pseudoscardovia radai]|uniref:hypothetical protein n=1 Tax=Pseudoscardovia radai TaxID=987066 RepID=UPI00117B1D1D|nr:hypothetical protein [Pseudoscardovia radai]
MDGKSGNGERRGKREEAEGWSQREMGRREKDLNGTRGNRGKGEGRRRRRRGGVKGRWGGGRKI